MFDFGINDSYTGHLHCIRTKNTSKIYVKNVTLCALNETCASFIGRSQPLFWAGIWSVRVKIIITGLEKLLNKLLFMFL